MKWSHRTSELSGCLQQQQGPWNRYSICKADQESKMRNKSQQGFGNSLFSFYNRVGGDEQDVSWL